MKREGTEAGFDLTAPGVTVCASARAGEWHVFSIEMGGQHFGSVGGQGRKEFLEAMQECLRADGGKPIRDMSEPPYVDVVGDALYMGYAVFSGYRTLYFLRATDGTLHVVLADAHGTMMGHGVLDPATRGRWEREVAHLLAHTLHRF